MILEKLMFLNALITPININKNPDINVLKNDLFNQEISFCLLANNSFQVAFIKPATVVIIAPVINKNSFTTKLVLIIAIPNKTTGTKSKIANQIGNIFLPSLFTITYINVIIILGKMHMDNKEKLKNRIKLFRDAANFKKTSRIPHLANAVSWKIFDAGYTLDDALNNFDSMEKVVTHFLDTYQVDCLIDTGIRNQFNVTKPLELENTYYYYNEETIGIKDHSHCTIDNLDDYLNDYEKYCWETLLPNKYGSAWDDLDINKLKLSFQEYLKYIFFILHIGSVVKKQYGLPSLAPNNPMNGAISLPIEELHNNLLGIRQLSMAMRRNPEKLDDFIAKWDKAKIEPMIEKIKKSKGPNENYCFDASIIMLAHNILNPEQFKRFYWPSLEKLLDAYAQKQMNVRIFAEGSIARFTDYFAKYPKGVITLHLEQDDPFEIREKLPNVCIMGGLTTDMLANATPQECVNHVKHLCETLGKEGGFILSENKMLSYRNDCKSENLKAICDYLNSQGD